MSSCRNDDAVATAEVKLATLKSRTDDLEAEQGRKAAALQSLHAKLEKLRVECETVRQRTCEVSADTADILSNLHASDELEILKSVLFDKKTQIFLQQQRHDALLQQLANMGAVLDKAGVTQSCKGNAANGERDLFIEQWTSCCERLEHHIRGADRYCATQQFHLENHPVSVLCKSLQKISRTARRREEELLICLEDVDAGPQQASLPGDKLRENEERSGQSVEGTQPATVGTTAATKMMVAPTDAVGPILDGEEDEELAKLRVELQQKKELHKSLLLSLEEKSLATTCGGGTLPSGSAAPHCGCDGADSLVHTSASAPRWPAVNTECVFPFSSSSGGGAVSNEGPEADNDDIAAGISFVTIDDQGVAVEPLLFFDAGITSTTRDPEVEHLQREISAAERDVHRLQQRHETLEEEAKRAVAEYEYHQKILESKLSKAQGIVKVLRKENAEWQTLYEQMSLLCS